MKKDNSITLAELPVIWDKFMPFKYVYFVRSILA